MKQKLLYTSHSSTDSSTPKLLELNLSSNISTLRSLTAHCDDNNSNFDKPQR
uniref:Uncharacterized protein n=1 Tax=Rhizophora mucronata TaxID=61149 RepID=A0A2P2QQM5_RHIMU